MERTFIVGNTGSGKSTLAKHWASDRGLLHIDLDQYAWTETIGVRRPLQASVAALKERLGGAPAVIEGMYGDLVGGLITSEDTLIWLDLPIEECLCHCRSRPFEPHKWESAEKQNEFLPQLLDFLRTYPERADELGRAYHQRLYEAHAGPKFNPKSAAQANQLLGEVAHSMI